MVDALGTTMYKYDIHGSLIVTNPYGHTLRYKYDTRGFPIKPIYPDHKVITYSRGINGQLNEVGGPMGVARNKFESPA